MIDSHTIYGSLMLVKEHGKKLITSLHRIPAVRITGGIAMRDWLRMKQRTVTVPEFLRGLFICISIQEVIAQSPADLFIAERSTRIFMANIFLPITAVVNS